MLKEAGVYVNDNEHNHYHKY